MSREVVGGDRSIPIYISAPWQSSQLDSLSHIMGRYKTLAYMDEDRLGSFNLYINQSSFCFQ